MPRPVAAYDRRIPEFSDPRSAGGDRRLSARRPADQPRDTLCGPEHQFLEPFRWRLCRLFPAADGAVGTAGMRSRAYRGGCAGGGAARALARRRKALGDGERRRVGWGVVAVRQDDDRETLLQEPHDGIAKADGFARVPTRLAGDTPAEAVLNGRVIGLDRGLKREPQRFRPQEPVAAKRGIPFREVVDRGIDTAVAQCCAGEVLIGANPRMLAPAIAEGSMRDNRDAGFERHRILHAEPFDNTFT